jgi:hypothetical protein
MVSVTDPYGRILRFLDWSRYFFFQVNYDRHESVCTHCCLTIVGYGNVCMRTLGQLGQLNVGANMLQEKKCHCTVYTSVQENTTQLSTTAGISV